MEDNLEGKLEQETKERWLRKAFKEEWPTMANHVVACGIAVGAAAAFSHYAPHFLDSDAAISGIATALDMGSYWGTMILQLLYRDRKTLNDKNKKIKKKRRAKKAMEYVGYILLLEGLYALGRFWGQYHLQKQGWDPAIASATVQTSMAAFSTFAFPPLRYAMRQWSEK
ncbi:hypothetical protein D6783_06175 [Candidatus Woesearchaeota archaeon]|nr:MAG: hypothetical protein D6783_06175 [Candidatus Woesearchaeota archaeon]